MALEAMRRSRRSSLSRRPAPSTKPTCTTYSTLPNPNSGPASPAHASHPLIIPRPDAPCSLGGGQQLQRIRWAEGLRRGGGAARGRWEDGAGMEEMTGRDLWRGRRRPGQRRRRQRRRRGRGAASRAAPPSPPPGPGLRLQGFGVQGSAPHPRPLSSTPPSATIAACAAGNRRREDREVERQRARGEPWRAAAERGWQGGRRARKRSALAPPPQ